MKESGGGTVGATMKRMINRPWMKLSFNWMLKGVLYFSYACLLLFGVEKGFLIQYKAR